tara:strand:- start:506 stop:880 length:375 start_codon:yes stop_codon:yes gene_type:complete
MKNYIIGLFCITFLFACGGSDNSSSSSEVVENKVEQKDDSAAKAFIKEFSDEYMASCAAAGNEQGLTVMFSMLGVDYNEYCQCTLDAGLVGETYESLNDELAASRLMMKVMNAAETCMSKYMPM